MWESRCYSDGIPDEVEEGLSKSMRVPSYKAIAEAILKNDLLLYSLGFQPKIGAWYRAVKEANKNESPQMDLL